jgi:N-hydroxyarylamine O-acetyltransferase
MNKTSYLNRIGYRGPLAPTIDTLRSLHLAHLLTVPFENLDIHLGRPIILDEERFYRKIVDARRGGFCYELNGLFSWLLAELGFDVSRHSARVRKSGGFGPEFDHLVMVVRLEERWLADVGFGDSFRLPLRLDDPEDQTQFGRRYRVARGGEDWTMLERDAAGEIVDGYAFTLGPRSLSEFAGMCRYHQTSPETTFTRKRVCTRATETGRITLSDLRLIGTENGVRSERLLSGEQEFATALREHFGIEL